MPTLLTFKQAAERLGLRGPRVLSDAFYEGTLSDEYCFYIGNRRAIPETQLTVIANALRRAGKLRLTRTDN